VTRNILFLCTGNSARSIIAETLLNHLGGGRFIAYSAGSHPRGEVNRFAVEVLEATGLRTTGLRSKSWMEFARPGAPSMDFVLTVCDDAAGEACPIWPGNPVTAHWGLADPAAVEGSDERKRSAFRDAAAMLRRRVESLVALTDSELADPRIREKLETVGRR
jgi:protein-tyrosine-phosphatase